MVGVDDVVSELELDVLDDDLFVTDLELVLQLVCGRCLWNGVLLVFTASRRRPSPFQVCR
jgi:hypothetical protein